MTQTKQDNDTKLNNEGDAMVVVVHTHDNNRLFKEEGGEWKYKHTFDELFDNQMVCLFATLLAPLMLPSSPAKAAGHTRPILFTLFTLFTLFFSSELPCSTPFVPWCLIQRWVCCILSPPTSQGSRGWYHWELNSGLYHYWRCDHCPSPEVWCSVL